MVTTDGTSTETAAEGLLELNQGLLCEQMGIEEVGALLSLNPDPYRFRPNVIKTIELQASERYEREVVEKIPGIDREKMPSIRALGLRAIKIGKKEWFFGEDLIAYLHGTLPALKRREELIRNGNQKRKRKR